MSPHREHFEILGGRINELEEELRIERTRSSSWEDQAKANQRSADYWRKRCEDAERCPQCDGTGTFYDSSLPEELMDKCDQCDGKGRDRGPKEEPEDV